MQTATQTALVNGVRKAKTRQAKIIAEHKIPGVSMIHGITFDGAQIWFAHGRGKGDGMVAIDAKSGEVTKRFPDVPSEAGTAFDGKHLYQIAAEKIHKVDAKTGEILGTLPAPAGKDSSGLAWAEGALWVGSFHGKKIFKIDATTGKILKTLSLDRLVTGVSFKDGELWHGALEPSEILRVDAETGEVLELVTMDKGDRVAGIELDDENRIWYGSSDGTIRAISRS